jgi:hypothetical protein
MTLELFTLLCDKILTAVGEETFRPEAFLIEKSPNQDKLYECWLVVCIWT